MSPCSTEESFNIIQLMGSNSNFLTNWKTIRDQYRSNLNSGAYRQDRAFTPHDYDKHCIDIYTILESILLKDFIPNDDFNVEHLFILNTAVILHDIYMAFNPDVRDSHSECARDFVIKQQQELRLPLNSDQAKCVGDVILGHSDLKDPQISTIDMLQERGKSLTGQMGKKINVRLLSALLRLADELDENSRRIQGVDKCLYGIVEGDDSWPHWRKCELLHFPTVNDDDNRIINLNINNELIRASGNYPTDIKILIKLKDKISAELKQLNDKVFCKKNGLPNWRYNSIEFCGEEDILEQIKKVQEDIDKLSEVKEIISNPLESSGPGVQTLSSEHLITSDTEFESRLSKYVLDNNYLKSGHFYVDTDGKCCARDWIDTDHMLQDDMIRDEVISRFYTQISGYRYNILGIGHNGLLLASILGFQTSNPFSYIIQSGHKKYNVPSDQNISIDSRYKIILVTDAIVTGNTINEAITELSKNYSITSDGIFKVFTIFYRKSLYDHSQSSILFADKLFSLNNVLDIELCKKPQCHSCLFKDNDTNLYTNKPIEL